MLASERIEESVKSDGQGLFVPRVLLLMTVDDWWTALAGKCSESRGEHYRN